MHVTEDHESSRQYELSTEQMNAIDLLVTGLSDREVGETVGVARETVTRWRNQNPHFKAELNRQRKDIWGSNHDRLRNMLGKAIDVLDQALETGDTKVALEMLKCMQVYGEVGAPTGSDDVDVVIRQDAEEWAKNELAKWPPSGDKIRDLIEYDAQMARLILERCVELWDEWLDDDE